MNFLNEGKKKEAAFSKMFKTAISSDKNQDISEHWDVKVELKFDIKSLKKISRNDYETNEFYHFVELKNVHGKLGWLYGEADFFAFETNKYWVIVAKEDLQSFVAQNVTKKKVNNVDECLYCLYTRNKRKDVITMVKTIDLMVIASQVIVKTDDIIEHEIGDSVLSEKRLKKRLSKII